MPNRYELQTALVVALSMSMAVVVHAGNPPDQSVVSPSAARHCVERCSRSGQWFVVESDNFQACSLESQASAKQLAEAAESLRCELQLKWLGAAKSESWSPKCQIVLHPNLASYVSACGRGSEHTVGSSLFKTAEGQIAGRRIDLLGRRPDYLTAALPHELTHVVLRDRFPATTMPRWADEGAAILADSDAKQGRHGHDLEQALAHRTSFVVAQLITMDDYPRTDQIGAFYGQSASLTQFLVNQKAPSTFIDFVELAMAKGYDVALQQCYGITNAAELDRLWREQAERTLLGGSSSAAMATLAAR